MLATNTIIGRVKLLAFYRDAFGVSGALAFLSRQLIGCPREIRARPKGVKTPLHVRVGTSDAWLYGEILLRGQYAIDLPFTPRTIVDAGANIGMTSVYYTLRYPQARVISVEAEDSNFGVLCRNVAHYPNVTPVHAALWKSDGVARVSERSPESGKWGFVAYEGDGAQVRAVTMRTLMREFNIESIDLLKVDIEGSEIELFDGCDWMDKVQALAIELHDRFRPGCGAAVNAVTSEFHRSEHREVTFYLRRGAH
jgi:FkbM family methyltransferase